MANFDRDELYFFIYSSLFANFMSYKNKFIAHVLELGIEKLAKFHL
ncbi:MAG: hypothetical protein HLUCCX10_11745 [Algoriphagus marincola HL-49]|uniref:Uncharacterized protein n=1 Tax=Algoriphagus marincola HL-49 TaxID=1305737 RepID=A0A0P7YGT1_9BACT|nr:MAG: hypothetical protein HLUCCX10_11745 [Algoriphagus marincola HL-49]